MAMHSNFHLFALCLPLMGAVALRSVRPEEQGISNLQSGLQADSNRNKEGNRSRTLSNHGVSRKLWSYWDSLSTLPKSAVLANASWKRFAPDFEIHFMSSETWQEFADKEELRASPRLEEDTKKFADWLRLSVLSRHGGVWLDATMILTGPLVNLIDEDAEISGVDLQNNLEPYLLAAQKGSPIMQKWHDTFLHFMALSEWDYGVELKRIHERGIEPLNGQHYSFCPEPPALKRLIGSINSFLLRVHLFGTPLGFIDECDPIHFWDTYLTIIVALNTVLEADGKNPHELLQRNHISTQAAGDTVNLISRLAGWDSDATAQFIMTSKSSELDLTPMRGVKLREKERKALEQWEHCEPRSVLCRLQELIGKKLFDVQQADS